MPPKRDQEVTVGEQNVTVMAPSEGARRRDPLTAGSRWSGLVGEPAGARVEAFRDESLAPDGRLREQVHVVDREVSRAVRRARTRARPSPYG